MRGLSFLLHKTFRINNTNYFFTTTLSSVMGQTRLFSKRQFSLSSPFSAYNPCLQPPPTIFSLPFRPFFGLRATWFSALFSACFRHFWVLGYCCRLCLRHKKRTSDRLCQKALFKVLSIFSFRIIFFALFRVFSGLNSYPHFIVKPCAVIIYFRRLMRKALFHLLNLVIDKTKQCGTIIWFISYQMM